VVPLISALREKAIAIQEETMKSIERKLPDLTERERRVLRKHTKSIVNQLLRDPILRIKEMAAGPEREEALELFVQLFALEERISSKEATTEDKATVAAGLTPRLGRPAYAGTDLPARP
jgi:glutamyl-tRNA reductase